jgi:hypothetical protein
MLYGKSRFMLCDAYKTINIALPFVTQKGLESLSEYTRLSSIYLSIFAFFLENVFKRIHLIFFSIDI